MHIVLVGDLFIPGESCIDELREITQLYGASYSVLDWESKDLEELNGRMINMEQNGPSAEPPPAELWPLMENVDVLIVHFCPVSDALLESAPHLNVIGTMRTGLSNIDTAAAEKRNIDVVNLPGRLADSVSEYTIGLMIAESRNIARSHEALRRGRWVKDYCNTSFCFELTGKTVGLIGFGEIGKKVARKLSGFDARILSYDPMVPAETMQAMDVEKVELCDLLRESDIVSTHVKLNESTRGLIGKEELAVMKPTSILINTARAAIMDREALFEALSERSIAGAAIDVFWTEPVDPQDPILHLENITVTSHLAGSTQDALMKSFAKLNKQLTPYYERLNRISEGGIKP